MANENTQIIKPRYLGGLTTLFWGAQTDLIWFAIPMAIILEARYFLNRRWALTKTDFYRVADLTSVGLTAMVLFLFLNRTDYHFITTLLSWLPILFFPLVVVLGYSTTPRMTLDVLFYSLRRQSEPVQQSWDMDYVFLGICLLAAGLNREGSYYFPVATLIVVLAMYQLRSPRFSRSVYILAMAVIFLVANGLQYTIRGTHLEIKKQTELWIANWISQRTDPLRTRTGLGQVGRLKLSDAIDFRIEPLSGKQEFPTLLQEAAYDTVSGTDWEVFDPRFREVAHTDDFTWTFVDDRADKYPEAKIYREFNKERDLVPVPAELIELDQLPATSVAMSSYGTIQANGLVPAPYYRVHYDTRTRLGNEPASTDLVIPNSKRELMNRVVPPDVVAQMTQQQAVSYVKSYLGDFQYSVFQPDFQPGEEPLERFLLESRAGHCEYFASATVLLLRQLGVPARYLVGYSIQEWNERLGMYVVRARHAHAWASAWVDGRWIVVDTTPPVWLGMEENQSGLLQPVWDYLGNSLFIVQIWWNDQRLEDYETELYIIGFILILILIWRISTSEQVILDEGDTEQTRDYLLPGRESPFFEVEKHLEEAGLRRGSGELMRHWLVRVGRPELLPMLGRHNRWRFDPRGLSIDEKRELAREVQEWLVDNQPETTTG